MARVIYSLPISELVGNLGGVTFQKNRSGNIVRRTGATPKNLTLKQSATLQANNYLIYNWQLLTLIQQQNWQTFANTYSRVNRWGQTKQLSGWNWYQAINNNRIITGNTITTTPPAYISPTAITPYTTIITPTQIAIQWLTGFDASSLYVVVYASATAHIPGTKKRGVFRFMKVFGPGVLTTIDITTEWLNTFIIPPADPFTGPKNYVHFLVYPINRNSFISREGLVMIGSNM